MTSPNRERAKAITAGIADQLEVKRPPEKFLSLDERDQAVKAAREGMLDEVLAYSDACTFDQDRTIHRAVENMVAALRELNAPQAEQDAPHPPADSRVEAARQQGRDEGLEMAARICEAQAREFLDPQYTNPQPVGSISERFACAECVKAIRAMKVKE